MGKPPGPCSSKTLCSTAPANLRSLSSPAAWRPQTAVKACSPRPSLHLALSHRHVPVPPTSLQGFSAPLLSSPWCPAPSRPRFASGSPIPMSSPLSSHLPLSPGLPQLLPHCPPLPSPSVSCRPRPLPQSWSSSSSPRPCPHRFGPLSPGLLPRQLWSSAVSLGSPGLWAFPTQALEGAQYGGPGSRGLKSGVKVGGCCLPWSWVSLGFQPEPPTPPASPPPRARTQTLRQLDSWSRDGGVGWRPMRGGQSWGQTSPFPSK